MPNQDTQSQIDEERDEFLDSFCNVAAWQGRTAYCLMSIYAVNPYIFRYIWDVDFYPYFLSNALYGIMFMIACRPNFRPLMPVYRIAFGILGSLSFNYSSLAWFDWLNLHIPNHTIVRTVLAYFTGRIFMIHFLAFLYHIDTRCTSPDQVPRRRSVFEVMYL